MQKWSAKPKVLVLKNCAPNGESHLQKKAVFFARDIQKWNCSGSNKSRAISTFQCVATATPFRDTQVHECLGKKERSNLQWVTYVSHSDVHTSKLTWKCSKMLGKKHQPQGKLRHVFWALLGPQSSEPNAQFSFCFSHIPLENQTFRDELALVLVHSSRQEMFGSVFPFAHYLVTHLVFPSASANACSH